MKSVQTILISILTITFLLGQNIDLKYFEALKFRNIGPAGMSGRITSIDVNLRDKDHIIIGSASGGVWESKNGGISWIPIFDDQPTQSIGVVKFNQSNPDEIWVGTGEGNPRNSHNSGAGIFKSIDGGKSWKYMGLKETKLIHRIIINELNPDQVLVGVLGSAWGDSEDRGIYMTKNGGKDWQKVLYIDENVGVGDMVADPSNPNKILAAMWEFRRTPWGFNSGGKGSGLYLSYDGGANWKEITNKEGLPDGEKGRIGLAFAPSRSNIVYALIEAEKNGLYKSVDGGEKWSLVSSKNIGNRPFYYSEIYVDPLNENRIYNLWSYVSKSEDGGKTFSTIMDYGNNVHPDHHAFWIDPDDSNYLINGNDGGLNISRDGAQSWQFVLNLPVGQFYHVDVDNDFPYNVYGGMQDNGSWIGPGFVLKSGGIRNSDWQEIYFGDGFDVAVRKDNNRYGYAMSQGGNLAMWDKVTGRTQFIQPQHPEGKELRYHWNAALALHPSEDCGLYYGSQYVHKSLDCGQSWEIISPDLTTNDSLKQDQSKSGGLTLDVTGAENHTTILCIAPDKEDEKLIWVGTDDGNIQLTRDGGQNWSKLNNNIPGLPENAWIPQIVLSEHHQGEAFVVVNNYRMNDWSAYLFHTSDYGQNWSRLVDDTDADGFVCSIVQDPVNENLLFLGTDVGLYFSLDKGKKWTKWDKGLPSVQIRDMKIQKQFDDLVLGTFGRSFYVLDDIKPLRTLAQNGSALLDSNIVVFKPGTAFQTSSRSYDGTRFIAQGDFVGDNKRGGAMFTVWIKPEKETESRNKLSEGRKNKKEKKLEKKKQDLAEKIDGKEMKGGDKKKKRVTIMAVDQAGDTIRTFKRNVKEGMNRISWRPDSKGVEFPRRSEPREKSEPGGMPLIPGDYKMIIEYMGKKDSTVLSVASDPRVDPDQFDPVGRYKAMAAYNKVIKGVSQAYKNLKEAKKSMKIYKDIISVQEDSIKKEFGDLNKEISGDLDSLLNLYMLPEAKKTEYRDNSNTLVSHLRTGRRFLGAANGSPNQNALNAVANATREAELVLEGINEFFSDQWPAYLEQIKALPLDIYKEFETIKIK